MICIYVAIAVTMSIVCMVLNVPLCVLLCEAGVGDGIHNLSAVRAGLVCAMYGMGVVMVTHTLCTYWPHVCDMQCDMHMLVWLLIP